MALFDCAHKKVLEVTLDTFGKRFNTRILYSESVMIKTFAFSFDSAHLIQVVSQSARSRFDPVNRSRAGF